MLNTDTVSIHNSEIVQLVNHLNNENYEAIDKILDLIPEENALPFFSYLIDTVQKNYERTLAGLVLRKVGQHKKFARYVNDFPAAWAQGIFITNLPFLKTRINLSFCDAIPFKRSRIDYDITAFDNNGQIVHKSFNTLHNNETHTIESDVCFKGQIGYGFLQIKTSENCLHSFRAYAYWYNDNGMTTTHEKGGMMNSMPTLIAPSIVCNDKIETFMAICNVMDGKRHLTGYLFDMKNKSHPQSLEVHLDKHQSILVPLSSHFENMQDFLAGAPGYMRLFNDGRGCAYYYAIHNKETGSWMIQHL